MDAMSYETCYRVLLAKENFKFSAAHFTLFPDGSAELLHGHNYQVSVELEGEELDELGLLCNLEQIKAAIREACARLDSRTLLPTRCPYLQVAEVDDGVEIIFGHRRYRLPAEDVVLLPLVNTSIELLARMLWQELAPLLVAGKVLVMTVTVAETAGQGSSYRAALRPAS